MSGFVAWWAAHVALPKEISVFIVSMIPLIEERGGLILARMLNMPLGSAVFWCVLGNIVPIPFILFGIEKLLHWLSSHHLSKIAGWLENKAKKNKPKIDRYGFFGLMLFVGIPLPGTGAWTGSLVASLFPSRNSTCGCDHVSFFLWIAGIADRIKIMNQSPRFVIK